MLRKNDLVNVISERNGITKKDATKVYEDFMDALTYSILDLKLSVALKGFGKFVVEKKDATEGYVPSVKDSDAGGFMVIPEHWQMKFKQMDSFKRILKESSDL